MSQIVPSNHSESLPGNSDNAPDIMRYWRMIRHRKKLMALVTFVVTMIAMTISLLTPKSYQSTTLLLPQLEAMRGGLGLSGILASAGGLEGAARNLGISLPGAPATDVELFMAILKSRTMADIMIKNFNLQEVYGVEEMTEVRKRLEAWTTITMSKEKAIKIVVEDTSPQRAADMANAYVSELDRLNHTLNVTKAAHARKFLQKQLEETQVKLRQSEEALKEFQTANRAISMETQSHGLFEATAAIQNQIMAQQIELEIKGSFLSQNNPEVERISSIINELRKQLAALDTGKTEKGMLRGDRLQPAISKVPTLALEYGRLLRDVKVQETLYTLIAAEYEQTKYQEARDTPTVEILDMAIPAERKSHPINSLNTLVGGVVGVIFSVLLAFFLEYRDRRKTGSIEMELEEAA
jgi:tyrosine-protein kinase Etk/Wzc